VEENQQDGSKDQVILEYNIREGDVGYFAKEYRPFGVDRGGAKVIDITAVMINHPEKSIRWILCDIKDTLAGENTVVKLYNQWSVGVQYLQNNILNCMVEYSEKPDLGVITRRYDEERMKRQRENLQRLCDEITDYPRRMTLVQRKNRTNIAKYRGELRATQAILDRKFQPDGSCDTYQIHIRQLLKENGAVYRAVIVI
jgi:hypothetical protein